MLDEPESDALRAFLDRAGRTTSSELLTAELTRAVRRRAATAGWDESVLLEASTGLLLGMEMLTIDHETLALAAYLDPVQVRTLDALHVASALQLPPAVFVSYDRRQLEAARRAGLETASPGAEGS